MKIQKKKSNKKTPLIIILATLIVAGGVLTYLVHFHPRDGKTSSSSTQINYDPPKSEEIQAGQDIKDSNQQKAEETENLDDNISVFIVDANQYGDNIEIRSYVENVVENNGTCHFSFHQSQETFSRTSSAFADASHTTCSPLIIPVSDFSSSGSWAISIYYSSDLRVSPVTDQIFEVVK